MNNALLFLEIAATFAAVVGMYYFFGKKGLTAWIAIASITANVLTAKSADMLGMSTTLGTVMFASNFLATDILCELHGEKAARQGVLIGLAATLVFMAAAQVALLYQPSAFDYAHGAMETLFALNLRISLSSVVMYALANLADVYLFARMREATGSRKLWLRNNVSTILCNCLENFAFIFMAFVGVYTPGECMSIALAASAVEALAALCDTPFLYLARKLGRACDLNGK